MKARLPQGYGGGVSNLQQLARQAQKLQEDMDELAKELEEKEYTATSGGGAVTVTVTGKMELKAVDMKPEVVDPEDVENLSWDLLWNEKYAGKILMFDNPRDAFAIAEAKLGYSLNTTDESELWASYEELLKQKKLLQAYVMDQVFSKMATGEAAIAPYYAGDGIVMLEENEDIAFGFPKETVNQFVDVVCIPKNSKNKEAAEQYINFLCSTETALANAEAVGYATPQAEAQAELDPEVRDDPMFYPPQEILDNTEIFMTLPKTVNKLMDDLWIKLKISRN